MTQPRGDVRQSKAFCEGVQARGRGDLISTNPHTAGVPEALAWDQGWHAGGNAIAHADLTAFAVGELVDSGGEVYCCVGAGTTGTGTAPTVVGYSQTEVDGDVVWEWMATGALIDLSCCNVPVVKAPPYVQPAALGG